MQDQTSNSTLAVSLITCLCSGLRNREFWGEIEIVRAVLVETNLVFLTDLRVFRTVDAGDLYPWVVGVRVGEFLPCWGELFAVSAPVTKTSRLVTSWKHGRVIVRQAAYYTDLRINPFFRNYPGMRLDCKDQKERVAWTSQQTNGYKNNNARALKSSGPELRSSSNPNR